MGFYNRDTGFCSRTDFRNLLFLRLSTLLPQKELEGMSPPWPWKRQRCPNPSQSILLGSMRPLLHLQDLHGWPLRTWNPCWPWKWKTVKLNPQNHKQIKRAQHWCTLVKNGESITLLFFSKSFRWPYVWVYSCISAHRKVDSRAESLQVWGWSWHKSCSYPHLFLPPFV